jgi:hypothetical protein
MVAKYDLGSGDFEVSVASTATLTYVWFKAIQDFSDGITVTGLALNTDETSLVAVGNYES